MGVGLLGQAAVYLLYIPSKEFVVFALLMGLSGFFVPLYRVGTDAMLADMFPPKTARKPTRWCAWAGTSAWRLAPSLAGSSWLSLITLA